MKDERKSFDTIEWYWETNEYKEWLRLAHLHPDPKKCGYWYYDNAERTYKYVQY